VPERFDAGLTQRWTDAIAGAMEADRPPADLAELLARHPELRDGGLFGRPGAPGPRRDAS
jgi:hypothetical protein